MTRLRSYGGTALGRKRAKRSRHIGGDRGSQPGCWSFRRPLSRASTGGRRYWRAAGSPWLRRAAAPRLAAKLKLNAADYTLSLTITIFRLNSVGIFVDLNAFISGKMWSATPRFSPRPATSGDGNCWSGRSLRSPIAKGSASAELHDGLCQSSPASRRLLQRSAEVWQQTGSQGRPRRRRRGRPLADHLPPAAARCGRRPGLAARDHAAADLGRSRRRGLDLDRRVRG
jgi:hypothetical protein